ncbi:hypothetical protein Spb1_17360 [Planctopirus ephydatiae]|uniref:Uncharacterized protein n=1 Tax=Planctopirus ephydatiae TaxID=2528019 RepID=A0A518GMH3_9PLAN|nr:hypothetical protein [Planctopirus ephydatiae]QDV29818.1 hypothetical protein Spb1_17360 [Planctopirus ephydatiae]
MTLMRAHHASQNHCKASQYCYIADEPFPAGFFLFGLLLVQDEDSYRISSSRSGKRRQRSMTMSHGMCLIVTTKGTKSAAANLSVDDIYGEHIESTTQQFEDCHHHVRER